jgi:hypothetical protein
VYQSPVQALAMRRKLVFFVGKAAFGGEITLAVLPGETTLAVLLDTALLIVVLWVVGTALAV